VDEDGDGYAPTECGGEDCDDSDANINPGVVEGPYNSDVCLDQIDNDCDGLTDSDEAQCRSLPGLCYPSGWCWENPLPQGLSLNAVCVLADDDVWAAGNNGMVLSWNGSEVSHFQVDTDVDLIEMWCLSIDDIWVAGNRCGSQYCQGVAFHWDGVEWSRTGLGSINLRDFEVVSMWGNSSDDIWVAGNGQYDVGGGIYMGYPFLFHWRGSAWYGQVLNYSWPYMPSGNMAEVFGFSSDDVRFFLDDGRTYRWNGSDIDEYSDGMSTPLWRGAWGADPDDIWMVGVMGFGRHWNGSEWEPSVRFDDSPDMNSIWGLTSDDIWAVGENVLHWDGSSWSSTQADLGSGFTDVHGIRSDCFWAVGGRGKMARWDGTAWHKLSGALGTGALVDIWGIDENNVWIVGGQSEIYNWDGMEWSIFGYTQDAPRSIWGFSKTDIWVGRKFGGTIHWDGFSWEEFQVGSSMNTIYDLWGSAPSDLWAVGDPFTSCGIFHWNGLDWTEHECPLDELAVAVWGFSEDDVWVVGVNGSILHWNGTGNWEVVESGLGDLFDVWGHSPNDIWFVGGGGVILHWSGNVFQQVQVAPGFDLKSIWGFSRDDVYVAGSNSEDGILLHWNGEQWSEVEMGAVPLNAVWGSDPDNIWVAGAGGAILRKH